MVKRSNARNLGTCDNHLSIARQKLEESVLNSLQYRLMDEDLCFVFCQEYTKHINRLRMEHNAPLQTHRREYAKIDRDLDKLIEAIANGVPSLKLKVRIGSLEDLRLELKNLLDTTEEAPILLHPNMAQRYQQEVSLSKSRRVSYNRRDY